MDEPAHPLVTVAPAAAVPPPVGAAALHAAARAARRAARALARARAGAASGMPMEWDEEEGRG